MILDILYACAVCFGDVDSSAVDGMNKAIVALLGTTGVVLSGIVASIFSIRNKSKKIGDTNGFR
tara:strand:+ start:173 stop:364 length:192 start_codon:yes stop_codon:yes gene_type:complete